MLERVTKVDPRLKSYATMSQWTAERVAGGQVSSPGEFGAIKFRRSHPRCNQKRPYSSSAESDAQLEFVRRLPACVDVR